jgi:hypothetical protein
MGHRRVRSGRFDQGGRSDVLFEPHACPDVDGHGEGCGVPAGPGRPGRGLGPGLGQTLGRAPVQQHAVGHLPCQLDHAGPEGAEPDRDGGARVERERRRSPLVGHRPPGERIPEVGHVPSDPVERPGAGPARSEAQHEAPAGPLLHGGPGHGGGQGAPGGHGDHAGAQPEPRRLPGQGGERRERLPARDLGDEEGLVPRVLGRRRQAGQLAPGQGVTERDAGPLARR